MAKGSMISGDLSHAFEGWLPRELPIGPLRATVVASNWMHGRPSVSSPCHCLAKAIFKAISGVTSVTLGWSIFWGGLLFLVRHRGKQPKSTKYRISMDFWRMLKEVASGPILSQLVFERSLVTSPFENVAQLEWDKKNGSNTSTVNFMST